MFITLPPHDSSSSNRAIFEDEPGRWSISSSNRSYFEDEAGGLRGSSSRKACYEDEAELMDGNSYLCEPSDDDTP